jgi:hypothetical protein
MPDHGFGRCDDHHEMVDSSGPAYQLAKLQLPFGNCI